MIDVLYLARGIGNSFKEIEQFFESYHAYNAGCEHKLHILAKAFESNPENYAKLQLLAQRAEANMIDLPDDGFDLMAYARAAQNLSERFIFCLNTSSTILYNNWLQFFEYHSNQNPKLGMIGSFGSWEAMPSLRSYIDSEVCPEEIAFYWKKYKHVLTEKDKYLFPNPHIRTNGVLMNRQIYIDFMQNKNLKYKFECYNLVSGSENISSYFTERGYEIGIINADGNLYAPEQWDLSYCFATIDSNKGLFLDNHIKRNQDSPIQKKLKHCINVWGGLHFEEQHPNVRIFSIYHDKSTAQLGRSDLYLRSNVYLPIFTGDSPLPQTNYTISDKSGDSISHKNPIFGELTAHYWIWKNFFKQNPHIQYIGFAHYRRLLLLPTDTQTTQSKNPQHTPYSNTNALEFFQEFIEQHSTDSPFANISQYDMILAKPYYFNISVEEFFAKVHSKFYLLLLKEILLEFQPEYREEMVEILKGNKMYLSTIFVMKKELFEEFCEWIFPMLFELEKRTDLNVHVGSYHARTPAFLHERFFNIWLCKKLKNYPLNIIEKNCLLLT